jgi:hypothetical protein
MDGIIMEDRNDARPYLLSSRASPSTCHSRPRGLWARSFNTEVDLTGRLRAAALPISVPIAGLEDGPFRP